MRIPPVSSGLDCLHFSNRSVIFSSGILRPNVRSTDQNSTLGMRSLGSNAANASKNIILEVLFEHGESRLTRRGGNHRFYILDGYRGHHPHVINTRREDRMPATNPFSREVFACVVFELFF